MALRYGSILLIFDREIPSVDKRGGSPEHLLKPRCGRRGFAEPTRVTSTRAGPFLLERFFGDSGWPPLVASFSKRGKVPYG